MPLSRLLVLFLRFVPGGALAERFLQAHRYAVLSEQVAHRLVEKFLKGHHTILSE